MQAASVQRLLRCASLAFLVALAAGAMQPAAGQTPELKIARTERCFPDPARAEGILNIEALASLRDGRLSGTGTAEGTILTGRSEMKARHEFSFDGTYSAARDDPSRVSVKFRVPGKFHFTVTRAPPLPAGGSCVHHVCVGQTMDLDYSDLDHLVDFRATLAGGSFDEKKTVSPGGHPCEVVTKLELIGGKPEGEILVTAEHDWIPAGPVADRSGALRYVSNKITFTLPEHAALKQAQTLGRNVRVMAMPKGYGGRLFETPPSGAGQGSRFLEFADLKAGDSRSFYYAWPAQPLALERETIEVKVLESEESELSGQVSFEVGLKLEVWNVRFVDETSKRRILVDEPLRVQVVDALSGRPVASALQKFDLAALLSVEQAGFEPPPFFGFVVDWFGFDILNWGEYLQSALTPAELGDPQAGPARITGSGLAWQAEADGSLIGAGTTSRPALYFRKVGKHSFNASIAGLVLGAGAGPVDMVPAAGLAEPSAAHKFDVEVTELPEIGGILGILFSCVGLAGDALDIHGLAVEDIPPLKRLKFVWAVAGCLKSAGVYAAGQLPLKRSVELHVAARTARQITAAAIDQLSTGPAPGRTRGVEEELRVRSAQAVVKGLDDVRLVLIRRSGLDGVSLDSAQDGSLQQAPAQLEFSALASTRETDMSRATAAFSAGQRVQRNDHFLVVPIRTNDKLRVLATGATGDGAIWVVTRDRITRTDISKDRWVAGVEIGADGIPRQRGAAMRHRRIPPLDLGAAPRVSLPASR